MPDADAYMVSCWNNLGFNSNYGMGAFPLTWGEVNSFSSSQSLRLTQWECEQLIMMSREYCSWVSKSKDKNCLSPWDHPDYTSQMAIDHDRKRVVDAMMKQRAERQRMTL